jgi:hypothetical protein
MEPIMERRGKIGQLCLAVGLLALLPTNADAAWLGFKNQLSGPVIIQNAVIVNNVVRRGKPALLQPGASGWDAIPQPGSVMVTIYDANQPSRILFQGTVMSVKDLFFAVETDSTIPAGAKLMPRAKLTPTMPPMPPPRR